MSTFNTAGPWYEMRSRRLTHARYDAVNLEIHVIFRDGTPWTYYEVDSDTWLEFLGSDSPGRFIHEVLDQHPYGEDDHDLLDGPIITIETMMEFLDAWEPPEAA